MHAKPMKRRPAARPADNRLRSIVIGTAIVLGVVGLGALLYLSLQEPEALDGLKRVAGLARGHDEQAVYEDNGLPPVGGEHSGVWQNCGIYTEPVVDKNAVHSLEHGAVWITYQPDLPEDEVAELQTLVRGQPFVLLSPYPGLQRPVVLTAWGVQLGVDSVTDNRIADFVDRYQQGPQTPELGASCTDGTGTPIG